MAKGIKWSLQAEQEFADILDYWANRNKSATYSIKLNGLFEEAIELI